MATGDLLSLYEMLSVGRRLGHSHFHKAPVSEVRWYTEGLVEINIKQKPIEG